MNENCEHGKRRYVCVSCGGKGICEHKRQKAGCSLCNPLSLYKRYKYQAMQREIGFALSSTYFLKTVLENCTYCGGSPEEMGGMGVDRIDSTLGYEEANCVPCCGLCNLFKNKLPIEVFLSHAKRISRFWGN